MILVQLSITDIVSGAFNLEPFVFGAYPGAFTSTATFPAIFGWENPISTTNITIIDFLRLPTTRYTEQDSYNDVVSQEASWYFDSSAQILYFHVEHTTSPLFNEYSQGKAYTYCSDRPIHIDGNPYDPLVKSVPDISQQQDLTNYSEPALISGSVVLDNTEGYLDIFISLGIYGNILNILFLDDDPSTDEYTSDDLVPIATLAVDDYSFTLSTMDIRVQDLRVAGNAVVPVNVLTSTDYPDIDPKVENTPIPLLYGDVREIPLICVNGSSTSGNVSYIAAPGMTDFGDPYVKDGDNWTLVSEVSSSAPSGTIVLAEADARDGSRCRDAKLVACSGIANTRVTDVIVDLVNKTQGLEYNASNYDTGEWEMEETTLGTVGVYIEKQEELYKVISRLQNGANLGFRYEISANGKRTIRLDDEGRDPVCHVPNVVIEDRGVLAVSTDTSVLAGTALVEYSQSYEDDSVYSLIDDSEADAVLAAYRTRRTEAMEYLGTSADLAAERAAFFLDRFSTVRGIFTGTLLGARYLSLRVFDLVTIEITPADFVDVDNDVLTGREYFGVKLIKIVSIAPDLVNRRNTISGVIISDAAFPIPLEIELDGEDVALQDDSGALLFAY